MLKYVTALILSAFALSGTAFAQEACPELSTLQVVAGYLSWLNFFKGLGAVVVAAGVLFFVGGLVAQLLYHMRLLLEPIAYFVSGALIASGYWVAPEYLTWTVLIGCLLFMGSVFMTIFIHEIESDDHRPLATLFAVVWGAIAIYYNMTEVGILTMLALVTLLGFSVIVRPFSYSFGWEDDASIPSGTMGALIILAGFVVQKALFPEAPSFVTVFAPGAFWVGTIVAFTGLLIMSSRWYDERGGSYFPMQIITLFIYLTGVAAGLILNINPLAGAAGTFLVFYLAAKPLEIPRESTMGFGLALMCSGGIMFGAWWYAMQNVDAVGKYLTATLG